MPPGIHFLGWDEPVAAKVCAFLIPEKVSGPVDLGDQMIVVPTRHAGQRLRKALAVHCADQDTSLLSPRVVTPTFFLRAEGEVEDVASRTAVVAAWADVLMRADLSAHAGLFPARKPEQDFTWAMYMGEAIQQLRNTLADGGYRIADVREGFAGVLQEPERWRDLAYLERAYRERLGGLNLEDPCDTMIRRSERPELPAGVQRIVVAAVPDPTPLMIRALESLTEQVAVVVLVHAPDSLADHFDKCGRPIAAKWSESMIDTLGAEMNIFLAGSPMSQSCRVLQLMSEEAGRFGPDDIAIGVPDNGVAPFLAADLSNNGLQTFEASGRALHEQPLYQLLEAFRALVNERSYAAFSSFLRHSDVLDYLQSRRGVSTRWVLEDLDNFQNTYLPAGLEDITCRLPWERSDGKGEQLDFESLGKAVLFVKEQVQNFEAMDVESAVRSLLQTVYEVRRVSQSNRDDREFTAVAKLVDTTLRELDSRIVEALGIERGDALELLLRMLGSQRYYPEHGDAVIDLEGWLELQWNDAPFLIITGMNEGSVPDGRLGDVFLPDSLRGQLNLRQDSDRLARDAYLMGALIESRRKEGRVCFISGKTGSAGDPLKPSRLLFRCTDEELPQRAELLFGDPEEKRYNCPPTISFRLNANPPADLVANQLDPRRISVTAFRDYLTCPFRFYLKHVLGMEALDDDRREMDARDFGSFVHRALQRMAEIDEMRRCKDEHELRDFLCAEAETLVEKVFGLSPPLQVEIQLGAARQRLAAAARQQAQLVREGWEIVEAERRIKAEIGGIEVRGRIDRIDRHRESGRMRILDYKTSDMPQDPEKAHFASGSEEAQEYTGVEVDGKGKRWIDLQLPLYMILLSEDKEPPDKVELGFFNLPKAVNDTGVVIWDGFGGELLESARTCAEGVVGDIRARRFWPPAAKVSYDDFESLFHADASDCIDGEAFEAFLKGQVR